MMEQLEID